MTAAPPRPPAFDPPNPATARGSSFQERGIPFFRRDATPEEIAAQARSVFQGPMRLADMLYGPWAILPAQLLEMQAIYAAHLRGPKIDIEAIEAKLGRALANEPAAYTVHNGVAVLPVQGVIAPKANMMTRISGGASAQMLAGEVRAAMADSAVQSLILSIDSPGGSVLGTPELAAAIRAAADIKPVVAHTDGTMASAAYWTGSAANHVYVSGPTVQVGSIGVVATHQDISGAEAQAGVKTTEITAGSYKRIASQHGPLTKPGRSAIQEQVDYLYSLFVDAVASHRGTTPQAVLSEMADGRVFIGQQALTAGLVDGFSSLDGLIESMATDPAKYARRTVARIKPISSSKPAAGARAGAPQSIPKGASMDADNQGAAPPAPITLETLRRDHAAVHAEALAAGAQAERERISAIRALALPGHDALIEKMVAEGKSPGDTAMALVAAERATHQAAADAHVRDAPAAVAASAAQDDAAAGPSAQAAAAQSAVALFNAANGAKQHA